MEVVCVVVGVSRWGAIAVGFGWSSSGLYLTKDMVTPLQACVEAVCAKFVVL